MARRDKIVALFEKLISEKGEKEVLYWKGAVKAVKAPSNYTADLFSRPVGFHREHVKDAGKGTRKTQRPVPQGWGVTDSSGIAVRSPHPRLGAVGKAVDEVSVLRPRLGRYLDRKCHGQGVAVIRWGFPAGGESRRASDWKRGGQGRSEPPTPAFSERYFWVLTTLYKPPRTALVRHKSCKTETPQVKTTGDFFSRNPRRVRRVPDYFRMARDSRPGRQWRLVARV